MRKQNRYRMDIVQPLDETIKLIPLTRGQVAIVDATDYEDLMQWYWYAMWYPRSKCFYAVRGDHSQGRLIIIAMHRQILGLAPGDLRKGDHRETGQTLDNRRTNLRIATGAQNAWNSKLQTNNKSGVKGVSFCTTRQMYKAEIQINRKKKMLGYRKTLKEAAELRQTAARKYQGEFANETDIASILS